MLAAKCRDPETFPTAALGLRFCLEMKGTLRGRYCHPGVQGNPRWCKHPAGIRKLEGCFLRAASGDKILFANENTSTSTAMRRTLHYACMSCNTLSGVTARHLFKTRCWIEGARASAPKAPAVETVCLRLHNRWLELVPCTAASHKLNGDWDCYTCKVSQTDRQNNRGMDFKMLGASKNNPTIAPVIPIPHCAHCSWLRTLSWDARRQTTTAHEYSSLACIHAFPLSPQHCYRPELYMQGSNTHDPAKRHR